MQSQLHGHVRVLHVFLPTWFYAEPGWKNLLRFHKILNLFVYCIPISDVDECSNSTSLRLNNCDQMCINEKGSYYCTCSDGYHLGSDKASCLGANDCFCCVAYYCLFVRRC